MSEIKLLKCDKCGTEVRSDNEEFENHGYLSIELRPTSWRVLYNHKIEISKLYLCRECLKKIGITERTENVTPTESIGDRLYDIVAEIIGEIVPEQYLQ